MYNRVSLLQEQGYHVEIVGQPITDVSKLYLTLRLDESF